MLKYINPRYPNLVFAIPDQAVANRYLEWIGGHPEEPLIRWAKQTFADPEGAFVDIGANCGFWTAHLIDAFRHVYAFEPNPSTRARLVESIELSKLDQTRITLFDAALGETDGTATLRAIASDACDASIVQYSSDTAGVEVPVRRLSDLLHDTKIALVKIDVEGFEYEVLLGAEDFLRDAGLPPILFEAWDENHGQRPFSDVRILLESYGYKVEKANWPEEYLATRKERP